MNNKYTITWLDNDKQIILAKIDVETSNRHIAKLSIQDPDSAVYLGQVAIYEPQLTFDFEHWLKIAMSRAETAGIEFIVEEK